jgi:hypothetical protein
MISDSRMSTRREIELAEGVVLRGEERLHPLRPFPSVKQQSVHGAKHEKFELPQLKDYVKEGSNISGSDASGGEVPRGGVGLAAPLMAPDRRCAHV